MRRPAATIESPAWLNAMNPPTICTQVGAPVCQCCEQVRALEAQLERTRNEYAAALTRITDAQLTVEVCDRLLAAIKAEGQP